MKELKKQTTTQHERYSQSTNTMKREGQIWPLVGIVPFTTQK